MSIRAELFTSPVGAKDFDRVLVRGTNDVAIARVVAESAGFKVGDVVEVDRFRKVSGGRGRWYLKQNKAADTRGSFLGVTFERKGVWS